MAQSSLYFQKPGVKFAPQTEEPRNTKAPLSKTVSDVKQKIPIGAEATSVLVGTMEELRRPAMAFVRLSQGCFLGNLTEVAIPIRFLFIILGPPSNHDYYEIGRSIATLMSDKVSAKQPARFITFYKNLEVFIQGFGPDEFLLSNYLFVLGWLLYSKLSNNSPCCKV